MNKVSETITASKTIEFVMHQLNIWSSGRFSNKYPKVNTKDFKKNVLESSKRARKGLQSAEVIEKGLNIYEKRDIRIDDILIDLNQQGLVSLDDEFIRMMEQGKKYVMALYTDNHSPAFQIYKKELMQLLDEVNEPHYETETFARYFYFNRLQEPFFSIDYLKKELLNKGENPNSYVRTVQKRHETMLQVMDKKVDEDSYILHIDPQLFLSREDMYEAVTLTIEGIDLGLNTELIATMQPYPNKRYAVPFIRNQKQKHHNGFYFVAPKEFFEKELTIILNWRIGEHGHKAVKHKITMKFNFGVGRFFSTMQGLSRSSNIPTIWMRSFDIDVVYYNKIHFNHNRKLLLGKGIDSKETTYITEKVELTSFPMHLHSK